jgi:hypothetical protein
MAIRKIPLYSKDLISELDKRFPDVLDTTGSSNLFDRGKIAGVVELLRELKYFVDKGSLK